jgi:hypothetical protein
MKFSTKSLILALTLFTALLLPTWALAGEESGCLKLKQVEATDYNAVAPGAMMNLKLRFKSYGCHLPVGPSSNVSLVVENQPALFVKTYRPEYHKVKKAENSGGSIADETTLPVSLTLQSALTPGKYSVTAVLNYEALDKAGNLIQQSLPVTIPLKVVASRAEMRPIAHHDHWSLLKITGMIAVGAVALPVLVVLGIVQAVTGIEILPDC